VYERHLVDDNGSPDLAHLNDLDDLDGRLDDLDIGRNNCRTADDDNTAASR